MYKELTLKEKPFEGTLPDNKNLKESAVQSRIPWGFYNKKKSVINKDL